MTTSERLRGWLTGRLPVDWFTTDPTVTVDRDEIIVVGRIEAPTTPAEAEQDARSRAGRRGRPCQAPPPGGGRRAGGALGSRAGAHQGLPRGHQGTAHDHRARA